MTDSTYQLAQEFFRRLRLQLQRQADHDRECSVVDCRIAQLISCGLADSWTTLSGIGYTREARQICDSFRDGRDA